MIATIFTSLFSGVSIPAKEILTRQKESFSPVGDLFAPFFDVVFYGPSKETGEIAALEEQSAIAAEAGFADLAAEGRARAAKLRAQLANNNAALSDNSKIGSSNLALRSVGGSLTNYSPAAANSALAELTNYRANLQITMVSAAALQATLTLSPPYEAAIQIVDEMLIKFGSLMEIQWGYLSIDGSGAPAVSDKGLFRITQPRIKFGQQTQVTIGGFDILSGSLSTSDTRCQWLREKHPCDLDIVREIVQKRLGKGADIDDTLVSNDSPIRKRKSGMGITQSDDDWTFFRRLLRQNNCGFWQFPGKIVHLYDEARVNNAQPKYRLMWYGQPQNDKDIPMIAFETNPIMSLFAGNKGARGQRTLCRDPEVKKVEKTDKDPSQTGTTQVGECKTATSEAAHSKDGIQTSDGNIAVFAELDKACTSGRFFTQPCRRPNQTEEIERENYENRALFNTRATATCPGVPGLIPQQICTVEGVGNTFGGPYRIIKATHDIGQGGYTVKVDLIRSADSGTKSGGGSASTDECNTKQVDSDAKTDAVLVEPMVITDETSTERGCIESNEQAQARSNADAIRAQAARNDAAGGPGVAPPANFGGPI